MKTTHLIILMAIIFGAFGCYSAGMQTLATPVQSASSTLPGHVVVRVAGNVGYSADSGTALGGEAHVAVGYEGGEVQLSGGAEGLFDTPFVEDVPRLRGRLGVKHELLESRLAFTMGLGVNNGVAGTYASVDAGVATQFQLNSNVDLLVGGLVNYQRSVRKTNFEHWRTCYILCEDEYLARSRSASYIFGVQGYVGLRFLMRGDRLQGLPESALLLGFVPLDFLFEAEEGMDMGLRANIAFEHEF